MERCIECDELFMPVNGKKKICFDCQIDLDVVCVSCNHRMGYCTCHSGARVSVGSSSGYRVLRTNLDYHGGYTE